MNATPTTIGMDEWIKAIEDAQRQCGASAVEGFTTSELADSLGKSLSIVRSGLKQLVRVGRAKLVGTRPTLGMNGRHFPSPVYALVPAAGKQRKKR